MYTRVTPIKYNLTRFFWFRQQHPCFKVCYKPGQTQMVQQQNPTLSFQSLKTNVFISLDKRWKSIQNNTRVILAVYCTPHLWTATTSKCFPTGITIFKLNFIICLFSSRLSEDTPAAAAQQPHGFLQAWLTGVPYSIAPLQPCKNQDPEPRFLGET